MLPSKKLTYPTLGKGKVIFNNALVKGYVTSLEGSFREGYFSFTFWVGSLESLETAYEIITAGKLFHTSRHQWTLRVLFSVSKTLGFGVKTVQQSPIIIKKSRIRTVKPKPLTLKRNEEIAAS